MLTSRQIRQQFIDFFREQGHTIVPSSPVVPFDDPTLLFTNAGMNQFKPIFLGQQMPDVDHWPGVVPGLPTRAANTQKCIRAGGKHNDLDDVGHDTYHHTFFEMLGNWSFGDYFKLESITWGWELLVQRWRLDPKRLHATYFQGDPAEGLEPDHEARDIWRKFLPDDQIHPGNKKDNFWEMGDTGPCGPCSEIHYDRTPDLSGNKLVNAGDPRVIEIWNHVFIQYNRDSAGQLSLLPARHVDTGMGFERLCAILQGQDSNYDTDVFTPIFAAIQKVTGAPGYTGKLKSDHPDSHDPQIMIDTAFRVIADHIRTLTFALTDRAMLSNEGRGYVLRRILRRAVRYGRQYLNVHEPFLYKLVPTLVETMQDVFPELATMSERVAEMIRDEEESFGRTYERGVVLFDAAVEQILNEPRASARADSSYQQTSDIPVFSGELAFKLHDTYGFPIDLTEIMAQEQGLVIDLQRYWHLMDEAKDKARAGKISTEARPQLDRLLNLGPCDDHYKYDSECRIEAQLLAISPLPSGEETEFYLNRTCFYAEQGGQIGDQGRIIGNDWKVEVIRTELYGQAIAHVGRLIQGNPKPGDDVRVEVNKRLRIAIMRHHTVTHVMNWALREVLGDHVDQKGSLVDAEKTRFDFSHPKPLTVEELQKIETQSNGQIEKNYEVYTAIIPQKEARTINTLRAVFGEKYPEHVRVVSIGAPIEKMISDPRDQKWMHYSVEFCGGTHVRRTTEIGQFRILEESAVAKGVRRIIGVAGEVARQADEVARRQQQEYHEMAKLPDDQLADRLPDFQQRVNNESYPLLIKHELRDKLETLQERIKQFTKQQARQEGQGVRQVVEQLLRDAQGAAGFSPQGAVKPTTTLTIVGEIPSAPPEQIREAIDYLRDKASSAAIFLASPTGEKVLLFASMTDDLVAKKLGAGDLIKAVAPIVGGGGGGKPQLAQAGGKHSEKLHEALAAARKWIEEKLRIANGE
ncbi:MAG: Alanine--tRNA ligase [Phycisphaerae bacterium]|nr:Alanine--tRNA ligase [Phycisphaerae bacterium]